MYELTILTKENTSEEKIAELNKKLEKYAEIKKFENEGTKRLAYSIRNNGENHERATYLFYELNLEDTQPITKAIEEEEEAIRYLLVKVTK